VTVTKNYVSVEVLLCFSSMVTTSHKYDITSLPRLYV